ncbi:hypothetical protein [Nocardia sp. NPDC005998]|uniref:hypothetical protein n=1 Tax=Nocardia sp. NPDC005998 TaxID=3156894 RepID=UPI0033A97429
MISTTQDLHTFISALLGGKLLPAPLLAEMCTPHPTGIPNMDYGLGVFVVTPTTAAPSSPTTVPPWATRR